MLDAPDSADILKQFEQVRLGKASDLPQYRALVNIETIADLPREWVIGLEMAAVDDWLRALRAEAVEAAKRSHVPVGVSSVTPRAPVFVDSFLRFWEKRWLGKPGHNSLDECLGEDLSLNRVASWAVWPEKNAPPSKVDLDRAQLKPWIMIVGMNWGGGLSILPELLTAPPWSNFHFDPRTHLRTKPHSKLSTLAEEVPEMRGAYMTDAFKLLPTPYAAHLREAVLLDRRDFASAVANKSLQIFREELVLCNRMANQNNKKLRIVAFGRATFDLLTGADAALNRGWPNGFRSAIENVVGECDASRVVRHVRHYAASNLQKTWSDEMRKALNPLRAQTS